jgi:hypothetical protein
MTDKRAEPDCAVAGRIAVGCCEQRIGFGGFGRQWILGGEVMSVRGSDENENR